jgi:hypothetical protein
VSERLPVPGGTVAIEVFVQHVSGAYSSGSVQEFHLIPFSLFTSKPFEVNNTNIRGKGTKKYEISKQGSVLISNFVPVLMLKINRVEMY